MLGAGLLAKKAVERGLERKPWVKTSLAPGLEGRDRLPRARRPDRAARRSSASTSSATAAPPASATPGRCRRRSREAIEERDLAVCSVLSGNRNFEGRIHPEVKMNYLASPPLCVAYALAGRMDLDLVERAARQGDEPSTCATSGPRRRRSTPRSSRRSSRTCSARATARCSRATRTGTALEVPEGDRYAWDEDSTYVKRPPYFEGMPAEAPEGFERDQGRARARRCSATASPPTTSRRRARSRRTRRRAVPDRARRRAARLQLLRLAPRQPRGDDARHVRQRPAAQPARARHRGRLHRRRTARRRRSSTPRWSTPRRACRCACWPARSTARARRATGPPRARGCSASGS